MGFSKRTGNTGKMGVTDSLFAGAGSVLAPAATKAFVSKRTQQKPIGSIMQKTERTTVQSSKPSIFGYEEVDPDALGKAMNGPLSKYSHTIVKAAKDNGLNPLVVSQVMALESGHGSSKNFKNLNNPGGLSAKDKKSGKFYYKKFNTPEEGIEATVSNLARSGYYTPDMDIYQIGAVYAPPEDSRDAAGTNSDWADNVVRMTESIRKKLQNPQNMEG